jgi:Restriction alleviation protein Lar
MTDQPELAPCPACGGKPIPFDNSRGYFYTECDACKMRGSPHDTSESADAAWNALALDVQKGKDAEKEAVTNLYVAQMREFWEGESKKYYTLAAKLAEAANDYLDIQTRNIDEGFGETPLDLAVEGNIRENRLAAALAEYDALVSPTEKTS